MNSKLLQLADKKIEQMQHYNEITSRMIYEDIDGVGELIDKRQEIITAMDGISVDMRQYVSEQSIERQEKLSPRKFPTLQASFWSCRERSALFRRSKTKFAKMTTWLRTE